MYSSRLPRECSEYVSLSGFGTGIENAEVLTDFQLASCKTEKQVRIKSHWMRNAQMAVTEVGSCLVELVMRSSSLTELGY